MHALTITRTSPRSAATLYRAWTTGWGAWFAEYDTAIMRAKVGDIMTTSAQIVGQR